MELQPNDASDRSTDMLHEIATGLPGLLAFWAALVGIGIIVTIKG